MRTCPLDSLFRPGLVGMPDIYDPPIWKGVSPYLEANFSREEWKFVILLLAWSSREGEVFWLLRLIKLLLWKGHCLESDCRDTFLVVLL